MKIECKLIREGGTKIELGSTQYHFEPLPDGAHVSEVSNEDHADLLLGIADAYRVYRGNESPKGSPTELRMSTVTDRTDIRLDKNASVQVLVGSKSHEQSYEIGGVTYGLGEVVARAHKSSGLSVQEWNELPQDEIEAKIDIALDDIEDDADQTQAADGDNQKPTETDDDRESLIELYTEKFGKAPRVDMKSSTLKEKLGL